FLDDPGGARAVVEGDQLGVGAAEVRRGVRVGHDDVVEAVTAVDRVGALGGVDDVVAGAAHQHVVAFAADQDVIAVPADQHVVAGPAVDVDRTAGRACGLPHVGAVRARDGQGRGGDVVVLGHLGVADLDALDQYRRTADGLAALAGAHADRGA